MPRSDRILVPDRVWVDDRFHRDTAVVLDGDGRIVGLEERDRVEDRPEAVVLRGRALLPGFVNAHSHAFQRVVRGRTQWRPASGAHTREDFWSWRGAMYGAALALSEDDVERVARFCFLEMLQAGITTVGEFHYLHHQPDGQPYPDPNRLATRVIAAAEAVGMRIVLLNVCYARGGIDRELGPRQRRFRATSPDEYLDRTEALAASVAGSALASVGVAPHSVRAVPRDWLPRLRAWARERDAPFHMHVSERPAEVEQTVEAYGLRPVELLAEDGVLDSGLTAVHATHLSDREVALLGAAGSTVCACPTTERDLGDGFLRGFDLLHAGAPVALGTDSHTALDMLEEMRLVEYHERLNRLARIVITDPVDGRRDPAPPLLRMATAAGARSLRVDAGRIEPGARADLLTVDLNHVSLAGWVDDALGPMLVLSATPDVVRDVWVDGVRRIRDGRHPLQDDITADFTRVASTLRSL